MVQSIQSALSNLLGFEVPQGVLCVLTFALCALLLRAFFSLFNFKAKYFDFAVYISIVLMALLALGGVTFSFALT